MKTKINLLQLLIFAGFMLLFSCEKNKNSDNKCNVSNPLTDLAWLKSTVSSIEQLSPDVSKYYVIAMATYNGETVFIESNCDPLANSLSPIYNCSGVLQAYLTEINPQNLTDRNIIWKPANSACGID